MLLLAKAAANLKASSYTLNLEPLALGGEIEIYRHTYKLKNTSQAMAVSCLDITLLLVSLLSPLPSTFCCQHSCQHYHFKM